MARSKITGRKLYGTKTGKLTGIQGPDLDINPKTGKFQRYSFPYSTFPTKGKVSSVDIVDGVLKSRGGAMKAVWVSPLTKKHKLK